MKKILALTLVIATCLSLCVGFTSCSCEHKANANGYDFDDTNHWFVCESCEEPFDVVAHTFGETERIVNGTHKKTCTVCNKIVEVTFNTEVTEAQFETIDLGENYVLNAEMRASVGDTRQEVSVARQSGIFCRENIEWKGNTPTHTAMFAEFVEGGAYKYDVTLNSNGDITKCTKSDMNQGTLAEFAAAMQKTMIDEDLLDFSLYTYDAEDGVYVANAAIGSYKDVKLGFEEGKLATIEYKLSMPNPDNPYYMIDYTCKYDIYYGRAALTIPTVTE